MQGVMEGSASLLAHETYLSYYPLVCELLLCSIFDKCSLALLVNIHADAIKQFFPCIFFFNRMILPFFYSVIITSGLLLSFGLRYKLDDFGF